MHSPRSRIAVGCVLAIAAGTFGPISRAVSMESRRLVEVYAGAGTAIGRTGVLVGHGASATVWRTTDARDEFIDLKVEERALGRAMGDGHGTSVAVDKRDRAILDLRSCDAESACTTTTWQGLGDLRVEAGRRTFRGTLHADGAEDCVVSARWSHGDVVYVQDGIYRAGGAQGSAEISCIGPIGWEAGAGRIYPIVDQY